MAGKLASRPSRDTLGVAIRVFNLLAFKRLPLLVITALRENHMKHPFWFPDSSFRDVPLPALSLHPSSSMPIGLPAGRKETSGQVHPLSRSVPGTTLERWGSVWFYVLRSQSCCWGWLLSLPPASGGRGRPWSLTATGAPGEAGLIPMSCYSLWALLPPWSLS